jgi:hypothetical protein
MWMKSEIYVNVWSVKLILGHLGHLECVCVCVCVGRMTSEMNVRGIKVRRSVLG